MPITSVIYEELRSVIKKIATTGLLIVSLLEYFSPILFRKGWITFSITITYPTAIRMVNNELRIEPAFTIAITAARMHHAVISSAAAQVITIEPSLVFVNSLSCTIRASTGNAVILIAMPMKSENAIKLILTGAKLL